MATFLLYPAQPQFRRADGLNAVVVPAADAASAPAAARALCKRVEIDAFDNFTVVEIGATTAGLINTARRAYFSASHVA